MPEGGGAGVFGGECFVWDGCVGGYFVGDEVVGTNEEAVVVGGSVGACRGFNEVDCVACAGHWIG